MNDLPCGPRPGHRLYTVSAPCPITLFSLPRDTVFSQPHVHLPSLTSFPQDSVVFPTAGPSVDPPALTPDEQAHVHLPSPPAVHPVEAPSIPRILAKPPSSMNPLPNPRFASQMRPIFTDQSKREQELRENTRVVEEQRLAAIKKVKHTVTVCTWLSDDDGPEEFIHQGGFVWPNFCISTSLLAAAGFQTSNEDAWYHLYNRSRCSWQRFKANHVIAVDMTTEVLIKDVNVKTCHRLSDYLADSRINSTPKNFQTNLRAERVSIKVKLDRQFMELNPSTPHSSTPSQSKRPRKVSWPRTSIALTTTQPPSSSTATDSELSSDMYCTPVKRRKLPAGNSSRTTAPVSSSTILGEDKRWPSDYRVRDVIHVLHSCKPPPPRTTIAQHFYSLTGIPFKSSTYYDAWSRWDEATQEQRDHAEGCGKDGLWKDFAVRVSLEKMRLKVARQRVLRRQRTAEAEESDGSDDSVISFSTLSSD
ncbi:uncharacterized protein LACBIDRAFT_334423 [Laccaria bicolor S238N-H82]|uniref:Predicted protein n=1 Tax=Laccaria bicolor (strain S238N-H82 / ATCC MYA-4686) TaxID=486041 RepID=B0DZ61_LACBS|nr:uncharacterized protein LACBIDRAFT_334423 [Laccaria bicolor S238N-H82]EDR00179.1 predicted protein [Laccaria bicolor S238N-H82]|eukprot:XP_001889236.1 predicted protein [Laccaria bicolor S238N-H82]